MVNIDELHYNQAIDFVTTKREVLTGIGVTELDPKDPGSYELLIESHDKHVDTLKRKYKLTYQNYKQIKVELQ